MEFLLAAFKAVCGGIVAILVWLFKGRKPEKGSDIVADPDPTLEAEIQIYRDKAESLHNSIPVAGFATHLKVPIDIEDIYIPLRAMVNLKGVDDFRCYPDSSEAEKHLARCDAGMEISLLDAFEQAEKRGRKGLVILGDPGSGKTTHMKRMLLWCLRKGPEAMGLPTGMLPIFFAASGNKVFGGRARPFHSGTAYQPPF